MVRLHSSLSQKLKEPLPQGKKRATSTTVDVALCRLGGWPRGLPY